MLALSRSVAVVIPYYNGSRYIERAIRSVVTQSVPAHEFIVVDDGSSDQESLHIQSLARTYQFRLIRKDNGGQGSARNSGVAACSADYICFLDQDDLFKPDHIEVLQRSIPRGDPQFGFNYAELDEIDANGKPGRSGMVKLHGCHPKANLRDMLRNDMFILPSASIISRRAFEAVGGFDEQFTGFEDDDLFMRIVLAGYGHDFIDRCVTEWCIHNQSTSYSVLMVRSRLRYLIKLLATFPGKGHDADALLRDTLIPRFERRFIGDAMRAVSQGSRDQAEILAILRKYGAIVHRSPSVGFLHKTKLSATITLIDCAPANALRIIWALRNRGSGRL